MNALLYRQVPTKHGETLVEFLAIGSPFAMGVLKNQLNDDKTKIISIPSPDSVLELLKGIVTERRLLEEIK